MNDQDRFAFPEPLGDEPRRFTPLLAVAGLVGALALVAIVYLLFFGGGGDPGPSASRTPGALSEHVAGGQSRRHTDARQRRAGDPRSRCRS